MVLGAHVSSAGGVSFSPARGVELGCEAIQLFVKNQRQWTAKPIPDAEAQAFKENYAKSGLRGLMVHDTYLINVGSPDPAMWTKSRDALVDEASRCAQLGVPLLNMHPGAHMGQGLKPALERIAKAIRDALDATQGSGVHLVLESMAGQGTTIGARFEDLRVIRENAGNDPRLGYCLDMCHLHAAGFDVATPAGWKATMQQADEHLGVGRIKAFHLNDSKMPHGSRVDRHANIGEGTIGAKGFAPLLADPRFAEAPMILETPKAEEGYPKDLAVLRRVMKETRAK
ncbi:MAG TPA: deoxyribonuclease IV [Candidatus Thermoplasmatota archaeon]|nr:deoxyribonuclease IV [Candidatus Thermoplasmatota archaeon]